MDVLYDELVKSAWKDYDVAKLHALGSLSCLETPTRVHASVFVGLAEEF
jgi:hypothetical protein